MSVSALPKVENLRDLVRRLGSVPLHRIRMSPRLGTATEQDVVKAEQAGRLCELVDGVLVEKVMGFPESVLTLLLGRFLGNFIDEHNLGVLSGPDGIIRLSPGLVRIPDLAFFSWDRLPERKVPHTSVAVAIPDLAIEVLSRGNTRGEMARKRREYLSAGVRLVWLVAPRKREVHVHSTGDAPRILGIDDVLDGGDLLPGFQLPLKSLFRASKLD